MIGAARSAKHRLATYVAVSIAIAAYLSPAAAAGPIGDFPQNVPRSSVPEARSQDDESDKTIVDRRLRYAIKASAAAIVMLVLLGAAWSIVRAMRPR